MLILIPRAASTFMNSVERRAMVPARASCHGPLFARSIMPLLRGKITYPGCQNPQPALNEALHVIATALVLRLCQNLNAGLHSRTKAGHARRRFI